MDIVDELERLSDLHRDGQLTDDEFDAAKAALLARQPPTASPAADSDVPPTDPAAASIRQELRELGRQQARLQLDHDWERERDTLMVEYNNGNVPHRAVPTRAGGVWIAVFGIVGGLAFSVISSSMMRGWPSGRMPPERVTIVDAQGRTIDVVDGADLDLPFGLGGRPDRWDAFPLFGLAFAAFGVWAGVSHYRRAVAYETAEEAYRTRRSRLDESSRGGEDDRA